MVGEQKELVRIRHGCALLLPVSHFRGIPDLQSNQIMTSKPCLSIKSIVLSVSSTMYKSWRE